MATNPDRASYFPAIEKKYGQPMSYWFDQMAQISDRKYQEQIDFLRENHGFSQAHANALVLYSRGSTSAHKFASVDDYFNQLDEDKRETIQNIVKAITTKFKDLELVIAWNQPMLKRGKDYVFGVSTTKNYLLIAPFGGSDALDGFRDRLDGYTVNKKTVQVPIGWKVDKKLLQDMVAARLLQIESGTKS